jgi:hypothetical protein
VGYNQPEIKAGMPLVGGLELVDRTELTNVLERHSAARPLGRPLAQPAAPLAAGGVRADSAARRKETALAHAGGPVRQKSRTGREAQGHNSAARHGDRP